MNEEISPDICVIGGGPGGIAAALAAAEEGVSVVLVEKARLGGMNVAAGAVPLNAFTAAAALHAALRDGPALGVSAAPLQVNLPKLREHIVAAGERVARNYTPERLTALGVRVVHAAARFTARDTVVAGDTIIRARRFILAVGAQPTRPDVPGLDQVDWIGVEAALELKGKPAHVVVLGAGRYAFQLAQAFSRLTIDATIIDPGGALPDDDPELTAILADRLRAEGVRLRFNADIRGLVRRRGGVRFTLADPLEGEVVVDASHLVVVGGRKPAVADLDLAAAGIGVDAAGIVVDRNGRTANKRIFAIGDAIAGPATVARAMRDGAEAVRAILYRWPFRSAAAAPAVVFTDPALASVGFSEAAARQQGYPVRVLRFPFIENDRAAVEGETAGMIKVIVGRAGRVLGAAIVGRDAGELIAPWALAVANRLSIGALARTPVAYPTYAEVSRRAAMTLPGAGLTSIWRRRIIELLRKFG